MWLFNFFKKKKPKLTLIVTNSAPEITITKPIEAEMSVIPEIKPELSKPKTATGVSAKGIEFLFHGEGFRTKPYLDTKGVATIGFGTTYYPDGKRVTMQDKTITRDEALALAMHHIKNEVETPINKLIKTKLNQNQYDAIVSLVYNIGIGNFSTSTVLRKINAGDFDAAADAFLLWNKPAELIGRRKRERELFKRSV